MHEWKNNARLENDENSFIKFQEEQAEEETNDQSASSSKPEQTFSAKSPPVVKQNKVATVSY